MAAGLLFPDWRTSGEGSILPPMSDTDPEEPVAPPRVVPGARGVDKPRALSYENYSFNFKIDLGARIAARYGAPAFALRRARLLRSTEAFWSKLERRYEELWLAAGDGRIAEDGRELRHNLLTADGTDPIGAREHRRRLFGARVEQTDDRQASFNRAWERHLGRCGLQALTTEISDFNLWFPIEANLPIDVQTEQYVWMGMPWTPPVAPTPADLLARFPLR